MDKPTPRSYLNGSGYITALRAGVHLAERSRDGSPYSASDEYLGFRVAMEVFLKRVPEPIAKFLRGRRIAVAGVSRHGDVAANSVFRKLRDCGYEVLPVNPVAEEVEGTRCFQDVASIPGTLDGVVIATHPDVSASIVRQCNECGVKRVWFHRSFGGGSVSDEAVRECRRLGMEPIVGGCPLMFREPVDIVHKCMRWWLQRRGRVPK